LNPSALKKGDRVVLRENEAVTVVSVVNLNDHYRIDYIQTRLGLGGEIVQSILISADSEILRVGSN